MNRSQKSRFHRRLKTVIGSILVFVYLIPVFWMYISGFKTERDVYSIPPRILPDPITIEPYIRTLESGGVRYFLNSLIIGTASTLLTVFVASFTAFALARMKNRLISWILLIFLIAQMLPAVLRVTPLFVIFNQVGLIDTYLSVILANASLTIPFAVVMLRTTFLTTPEEVENAALIDGCSVFQSFLRVTIPIAKPGLAVVGVMSFVWSFGDFVFALSFLTDSIKHPATVGLYNFVGAEATNWNNVMAFAGLTALPLILVFLVFQKLIIRGLSAGSFR